MSNWWYERWKEGKHGPVLQPVFNKAIFVKTPPGDGAHDDMIFASALATKALWDRLPWWKKLWLKIKAFLRKLCLI